MQLAVSPIQSMQSGHDLCEEYRGLPGQITSRLVGFGRLFCLALAIFLIVTPDVAHAGRKPWNGDHVMCQERISFAQNSALPLPSFPPRRKRGLCARTVNWIKLHRKYGEETAFFGIAAMTTAGLAAIYSPTQRFRYSDETWDFMVRLSRRLEKRAAKIVKRFESGAISGNALTKKLLNAEQKAVERALARLKSKDPAAYKRVISDVGKTLNVRDPGLLLIINSNRFLSSYHATLGEVRTDLGRKISFASKEHRVKVGLALARLVDTLR